MLLACTSRLGIGYATQKSCGDQWSALSKLLLCFGERLLSSYRAAGVHMERV